MDDLLKEMEAFVIAHDFEDTPFGLAVMNDPNLLRDVREGRKLRRRTVRKIRDFMAQYKPPRTKKRA